MRLRTAPEDLAAALDTSHRVRTRVDSWLGGVLVGADVPLLGGELTEAADGQVPESVRLSVPVHDPETGRNWNPRTGPDAALASNGQRLRLAYLVERGGRAQLTTQLGWFQVVDWDTDGRTVEVTAAGLLNIVQEYRLLAPTSPPPGATFKSEIRRLLQGLLPVYFAPELVDRAVPAGMAWQDDRLGALWELADAWPAAMFVDESGTLTVVPPPGDEDAAVTLHEYGGTVVSAHDGGSRDNTANVVVARGEDSGDPARPPVTAVARDEDPSSPTFVDTYGHVVQFFASPLLTSTAQALAAAETILARKALQARSVPLATVPDPRVRPWVRADYVRRDGSVFAGRVTSSTLPLTPSGGAASVEIGSL